MPLRDDRKMGPREAQLRAQREAKYADRNLVNKPKAGKGLRESDLLSQAVHAGHVTYKAQVEALEAQVAFLKRELATANTKLEAANAEVARLSQSQSQSQSQSHTDTETYKSQPWVKLGISRASYYRKRAREAGGA